MKYIHIILGIILNKKILMTPRLMQILVATNWSELHLCIVKKKLTWYTAYHEDIVSFHF